LTIREFLTNKVIPAPIVTREELVRDIRKKIKDGFEMSWFTTDIQSYEWSEINDDVDKFLRNILIGGFKEVSIGYFNHKTKGAIYETYEVVAEK